MGAATFLRLLGGDGVHRNVGGTGHAGPISEETGAVEAFRDAFLFLFERPVEHRHAVLAAGLAEVPGERFPCGDPVGPEPIAREAPRVEIGGETGGEGRPDVRTDLVKGLVVAGDEEFGVGVVHGDFPGLFRAGADGLGEACGLDLQVRRRLDVVGQVGGAEARALEAIDREGEVRGEVGLEGQLEEGTGQGDDAAQAVTRGDGEELGALAEGGGEALERLADLQGFVGGLLGAQEGTRGAPGLGEDGEVAVARHDDGAGGVGDGAGDGHEGEAAAGEGERQGGFGLAGLGLAQGEVEGLENLLRIVAADGEGARDGAFGRERDVEGRIGDGPVIGRDGDLEAVLRQPEAAGGVLALAVGVEDGDLGGDELAAVAYGQEGLEGEGAIGADGGRALDGLERGTDLPGDGGAG